MHFNAMCLIVKLCISCEPADPDVDEIRPCKFWVKGKANTSSIKPQIPTNIVSSVLGGRKINVKKITNPARAHLQPDYGNGVFGNVYLSAGQYYEVNIAGTSLS